MFKPREREQARGGEGGGEVEVGGFGMFNDTWF